MRMVQRAVALVAVAGLGFGLSACGDDEPATEGPTKGSSSPSPSESSPSPSATASAKPTLAPLSAFETRPPVKAARQMAIRLGKAVNQQDRTMASIGEFATPAGKRILVGVSQQDYGDYFPGPQPFTPVGVKTVRNTAVITACWWSKGWGQDRKTKLPAGKREIQPARISLTRTNAGQWQVDNLAQGTNDCRNVKVKGRPW